MRPIFATRPGSSRRFSPAALLLVLAASTTIQTGCGREFFREWANQDVSEAVFEKSRDPRWRIDLFSHTPPAMSRFADPYDPDNPPAPPDDLAAEAMSPVPQWPNNRLMVPLEGTGYLTMMEKWRRDQPAPESNADIYDQGGPTPAVTSPAGEGRPSVDVGPTTAPLPTDAASPFNNPPNDLPAVPPAPPIPSPNRPSTPPAPRVPAPNLPPGTNSGTNVRPLTPISSGTAARTPSVASAPRSPSMPTVTTQTAAKFAPKDSGLRRTAAQEPAQVPLPAGNPANPVPLPPSDAKPGVEQLRTPRVPQDPDPTDANLAAPIRPQDLRPNPNQNPNQTVPLGELEGLLAPRAIPFYEAEAAGLPRDSRPYVVNMEQAFTLALINSRTYQFQLEDLYLACLPVTLNRFNFTPQFFAGLSPSTGILGPAGATIFPSINPGTNFLYRTAETGSQASLLNIGTVAGIGKVFNSGGRILASFASQVVFNFTGSRPSQPSVQSFLPLQIVQPFLRGGGRAVTLEALTQAERSLLYQVRRFAKFRQEFVVSTLVGGQSSINFGSTAQVNGFSGGGNSDPVVGFLNVVQDLQSVENDVRNVAAYDQFFRVYQELVKGESSGLSQLQVDQIDQNRQQARQNLLRDQLTFRNDLDQFKLQLGLPPDVPMVVDRSLTLPFKRVFDAVDEWSRNPKRELTELDAIAARLPDLQDVVIDGRSALGVADEVDVNLEDLLIASERVALENRLDLMNARANLYDAWRQIRVTANALQGVLNVSLTNQFVTPPNTTNPFAFVDQAKNFQLVINGELPLIRMSERNNFAGQLINYQRQRRSLMNAEDTLKFQIRSEIRNLHQTYRTYEIARRNYVLSIRQKDQSFENIIAPPAGTGGNTQGAVQTTNLITAQNGLIQQQNTLVSLWLDYQSQRLAVYRDLGTMPYDEWEAFYEFFPAADVSNNRVRPGAAGDAIPVTGPVNRGGVGPAGPAVAPPVGRP